MKLTDNRYNTIVYKARAFYYAWADENGVITDKGRPNECIRVLTVDRAYDYKSTLNMPKGDFMIFDEFVGQALQHGRVRLLLRPDKDCFQRSLIPCYLYDCNTISTTSPYYSELEIKKYLRAMKSGEHMSVETEAGTKIYIELAALPTKAKEKKRAFFNAAFLGFKNDKLGAITGGQLWALPRVPHTYRRAGRHTDYHNRNIYLKNDGDVKV